MEKENVLERLVDRKQPETVCKDRVLDESRSVCCPRLSCKRVRLILPFLVFCVFLPFLDVITDLYGGAKLIERGHTHWGLATLFLSFMPFVGHLTATLFMSKRRHPDFMLWQQLKKEAWQHLPLIQIQLQLLMLFRNTSYFMELYVMDTDQTSNYSQIESIQVAASSLGLYEAFLEAGPQLVLQLSIVLRSGFVSTMQLISMPVSLLSLAYGSTKAFYSQRLSPYSDPNPPLLKYVLTLLIPHVLVTMGLIVSWAFVFAYASWFTCVELFLTVVAKYLLYKSFQVESSLEKLQDSPPSSSSGSFEAVNLTWKSIFTSIMSPCVVGHHKSFMLILSHISTVLCLLLWLLLISPIQRWLAPVDLDNDPPVTHCFREEQEQRAGHHVCLWDGSQIGDCNQSYIRRCDGEEEPCFSSVRFCQDDETEFTVLNEMVVPLLSMLLIISVLAGQVLQWLSSYANVYRFHSRLFRDSLVVHRSLLCANAAEDDHDILDQMITKDDPGTLRDVVSRCNAEGETPLHIACRKGHYEFAKKLVVRCSAKRDKRNSLGRTPLHVAAAEGNLLCVRLLLFDMLPRPPLSMMQDLEKRLAFDLACHNGHADVAKVILHPVFMSPLRLQEDADQDRQKAVDWKGRTFLHLAVLNWNLEHLARVLDATQSYHGFYGQNLLEVPDDDGRTPLHLAAMVGFTDGFEMLMKRGADLEAQDCDHKLPIMLAHENGHKELLCMILGVDKQGGRVKFFYEACKQERTSFLAYFVDRVVEGDYDLLNWCDPKALTSPKFSQDRPRKEMPFPLSKSNHKMFDSPSPTPGVEEAPQTAFTFFRPSNVQDLLNHHDETYGTLAHVAAKSGQVGNLRYLHERGADLCKTSLDRHSPLHDAAVFGHLECLKYLTSVGADADVPNQSDHTPSHLAAKWGHADCLEFLINLCAGDALNRRNHRGDTPLALAMWSCSLSCVRLLVGRGADPNSRNSYGEHIVHKASRRSMYGQWNVLEASSVLRFLAGQKGIRWDVTDGRGRDVLTVAIDSGFREAVVILEPLIHNVDNDVGNYCDGNRDGAQLTPSVVTEFWVY